MLGGWKLVLLGPHVCYSPCADRLFDRSGGWTGLSERVHLMHLTEAIARSSWFTVLGPLLNLSLVLM